MLECITRVIGDTGSMDQYLEYADLMGNGLVGSLHVKVHY